MTPQQIKLRIQQQFADGDFPQVRTDAVALDAAAGAVRAAGTAVAQRATRAEEHWGALGAVLQAPGVIDHLYDAMHTPSQQATELSRTAAAIATTLESYATAVHTAKPKLQRIAEEAGELLLVPSTTAEPDEEDPASTRRYLSMERDRKAAVDDWDAAQRTALIALQTARDGIDPALLRGAAAANSSSTASSHGSSGLDGFGLGLLWLTGAQPRHRVMTADDPFTRRIRATTTVQLALRQARWELSQREARDGPGAIGLDRQLGTVSGRDLSGIPGVFTFLGDAGTVATYPNSLENIDESFLGSYALDAVPVALAGRRKALVRFTLTNATTAASGTRIPGLGYLPGAAAEDRAKDAIAESTGVGPQQTQVITWTEVVTWPPGRVPDPRYEPVPEPGPSPVPPPK